jgi:hypothetical protein
LKFSGDQIRRISIKFAEFVNPSLNKFSNFIHVLYSITKHWVKNDYFPIHILFTTIYLLQEHKLNPKNYSEQKSNMDNFVQATEHGVHMYTKFGDFMFYVFL